MALCTVLGLAPRMINMKGETVIREELLPSLSFVYYVFPSFPSLNPSTMIRLSLAWVLITRL